MKVTKVQAAANRAALIRAAARLFRERGIDGVGVAEICKSAGLTHGALYAQFPSKDALAAEALAYGLDRSLARMTAPRDNHRPALTDYLDVYLSSRHRDDLADGCPMTASASEIARQDEAISAQFSDGFERTVEAVQSALEPTTTASTAAARQRALAITAAMIGGIAAARGVYKACPDLSDEILTAVRQVLGEVGGEAASQTATTATAPAKKRG